MFLSAFPCQLCTSSIVLLSHLQTNSQKLVAQALASIPVTQTWSYCLGKLGKFVQHLSDHSHSSHNLAVREFCERLKEGYMIAHDGPLGIPINKHKIQSINNQFIEWSAVVSHEQCFLNSCFFQIIEIHELHFTVTWQIAAFCVQDIGSNIESWTFPAGPQRLIANTKPLCGFRHALEHPTSVICLSLHVFLSTST